MPNVAATAARASTAPSLSGEAESSTPARPHMDTEAPLPLPQPAEHSSASGSGTASAGSPNQVRFHRPANDPTPPGCRYCIITPCRDEQDYAEQTLRSIAEQTQPPSLWVVVDDGSHDRTPQILKQWQEKLPYLRIITRSDRGDRKLGGGVIDAFYEGYNAIDPDEFDFVCKLDLDLDLPSNYFADVMDIMQADPRLGTFSGKPYFHRRGKLVSEMCGDENAVGMVKFYRTAAFEQIGGFVRELMWDGIDGHRCRMLGWRAESRDDERVRFIHLRPMGTSHRNWWTGRQRHGRGQYFMGTGLPYMVASALYRMTRPPLVIGGVAMLVGYMRSMLTGMRRYDDLDFRHFLRRYQWMCLLMGKRWATSRLDTEQAKTFADSPSSSGAKLG